MLKGFESGGRGIAGGKNVKRAKGKGMKAQLTARVRRSALLRCAWAEFAALLVFRRFAQHLLMRNILQDLLETAQTFVDRHQFHQRRPGGDQILER